MAALGGILAAIGSLDAPIKKALTAVFNELVPYQQFGPVMHGTKATNFLGYTVESTTPASSNTEFSIEHGMGRAPYRIMPSLDLISSGAQIVPLRVTRPSDARRIYLSSPSTSALFSLYIE